MLAACSTIGTKGSHPPIKTGAAIASPPVGMGPASLVRADAGYLEATINPLHLSVLGLVSPMSPLDADAVMRPQEAARRGECHRAVE